MNYESENDPRNIAMILDVYEEARNGAVVSTQRFSELLRSEGYNVSVISTGKEYEGKVSLPEFYFPFAKNVMQRMKTVFAWPLRRKLLETFSKTDLVHVHFPFYLGIEAIRTAREARLPVVSTFHVQGEQLMHNIGVRNQKIIDGIYAFFMRYIYNVSDLVICPSRFAQEELTHYGLQVPSVVISNGITPEYHPQKYERRYPDDFVLLTVGRNAAEKRQDMLIRAVARSVHKNAIRLVIIGDGPRREHLKQLADELLPGRVEFLYLPTSEVIPYYNTSDLYVHAAEVETECMTALEAMGCGLPLLISNSPKSAAKQFSLDERGLFRDEEELTKKIDYWFEHQDALREERERYLQASEQYRIEVSFRKLKEAYAAAASLNALKIAKPAEVFI